MISKIKKILLVVPIFFLFFFVYDCKADFVNPDTGEQQNSFEFGTGVYYNAKNFISSTSLLVIYNINSNLYPNNGSIIGIMEVEPNTTYDLLENFEIRNGNFASRLIDYSIDPYIGTVDDNNILKEYFEVFCGSGTDPEDCIIYENIYPQVSATTTIRDLSNIIILSTTNLSAWLFDKVFPYTLIVLIIYFFLKIFSDWLIKKII